MTKAEQMMVIERELMRLENFLINDVRWIIERVSPTLFERGYIGGSCAFLLYGIRLNRIPKDIDIIVNKEDFDRIAHDIRTNPLVKVVPQGSSEVVSGFRHISFKTVQEHVFDVIENHLDEDIEFVKDYMPFPVCLRQLLAAKKLYTRPKDKKDLEIIEKFILDNSITF